MNGRLLAVLFLSTALSACGGGATSQTPDSSIGPVGTDAAHDTVDATGGETPDGGGPGTPDARPGTPDASAGTPDASAGTPDASAGTPDASAGTPDASAGTPDASAGTPDASATPRPDAHVFVPADAGPLGGNPTVTQIVGGGAHTCALLADQSVRCWGQNCTLFADTTSCRKTEPFEPPGLPPVIQLAAGGSHDCAVTIDHEVMCWGSNAWGQLGFGIIGDEWVWMPQVVEGLSGVNEVALGDGFSCALQGDGTVQCWGGNPVGQLGDGTSGGYPRTDPEPVLLVAGAVHIAAGGGGDAYSGHVCALMDDRRVMCWGSNLQGETGVGTTNTIQPVAKYVEVDNHDTIWLDAVEQISLGYQHSCALDLRHDVYCWGDNSYGQLGLGQFGADIPQSDKPSPVDTLWGEFIHYAVSIATGAWHSCAIKNDGATVCWGNGDEGQLGDGLYGAPSHQSDTPTPVLTLDDAVQLGLGGNHSCALPATGGALCWGYNIWGQVGDGTYNRRVIPTAVVWP